ncbi:MAG: glycosyltransferase [Patescibacteria group bacterium]
MKKNVSIVIIHYKTIELLEKCLSRLQFAGRSFDIIVVDNDSKQDFHSLKKSFPEVQWILNERNRGFSFAANQGILAAHARWILFLNPDVQISSYEVEELFHYAEKAQLDALSPNFNDERYRKSLPTLSSLLSEFTPLNQLSYPNTGQKTLVGGCLLIRKKVIEKIGGWDERFFLWFEDSDLTQRLLSANFRVGFAPFNIKHIGGASVGKLKINLRNQTFFHSMNIYSIKHFSGWKQKVLRFFVINRFTAQSGYPISESGSTWVVPNMKLELLLKFLETNRYFFSSAELTIVSSVLNTQNIWKLRATFPSVRFIPITKNKGFSSTVNVGMRVATTPLVGTLNDDVILNADTLPGLLAAFSPLIGSINPVIYSEHEELESAGIKILPKGKAVPITTLPDENLTSVSATNAACVLYNASALAETGLFDENFGSYLEDIDLSLRISKHGFSNIVVKASHVIHLKHSSSKHFGKYKQYLDMKNWWLVILKNWSITQTIQNFPMILVERLRNISGLIKS